MDEIAHCTHSSAERNEEIAKSSQFTSQVLTTVFKLEEPQEFIIFI